MSGDWKLLLPIQSLFESHPNFHFWSRPVPVSQTMSYSQQSSRRSESSGNPISLFPFLAVLLCTMGALISILLIIARQAQLSSDEMLQEMLAAENVPAAPRNASNCEEAPDLSDDLFDLGVPGDLVSATPTDQSAKGKNPEKDLKEDLSCDEIREKISDIRNRSEQEKWRLEELLKVRTEAARNAQQARIALSTTQENRDRLLKQAENFAEALRRLQTQKEEKTTEDFQSEIARKEAELRRLLAEFEKAENSAQKQNGSYAILPHSGPNGTRRYPIYVECREDGAWLMPENLKLSAQDFEGALSMENPLEMALMAKRQYLLQNGIFRESLQNEQEPYPLIIVRPGGILYLYMVKSALQSWKSEFGYELVDDSLPIAYPPNDENLKQEMVRAIQRARLRQQEIAAMAPTVPQHAGGSGSLAYRPTSQGAVPMNLDRSSRLAKTLQRSAAQSAAYQSGTGNGSDRPAGSGLGNSGGANPAQTFGAYGANGQNALPDQSGNRSGNHSENGSQNGTENGSQNAASNPPAAAQAGNLSLWSAAEPGTEPETESDANSGSHAPNAQALFGTPSETPSDAGQKSAPPSGISGVSESGTQTASNGQAGQSAQSGQSGQNGQNGPAGPTGPTSPMAPNGPNGPTSIAAQEGQNWALENFRPSLTSLTRPLPMECRKDRFVLLATPGDDPVEIPVTTPIPTVKRLAREIGTKIRHWGDAGRGVYWKPILRVRVAPDARQQFEVLQVLLEGSGLEIEEVKEPSSNN